MTEAIQGQIKFVMIDWQSGTTTTAQRDPMIGPVSGNDFLFFRLANQVVVVPYQFDVGVIGI